LCQTDPQPTVRQDTCRRRAPRGCSASAGGQSQGIQLTVIRPGAHSCPWPHRTLDELAADWGPAVRGDHPAVAQRLAGVHPVPGLRRRDPHGDLLHQRDRVSQRPVPPGHQGPRPFPTEQAALKCLYLVTRSLDPTGAGQIRWTMRWKPAINAFAITFGDRFPAAETY
jgi:hypothetical protein